MDPGRRATDANHPKDRRAERHSVIKRHIRHSGDEGGKHGHNALADAPTDPGRRAADAVPVHMSLSNIIQTMSHQSLRPPANRKQIKNRHHVRGTSTTRELQGRKIRHQKKTLRRNRIFVVTMPQRLYAQTSLRMPAT